MTDMEMQLLAEEAQASAEFLFRVARAAGVLRNLDPGNTITIKGVDNSTLVEVGPDTDIATLGYNAIQRLREVRRKLDLPDLSEQALTHWDVFQREALSGLPELATCH